MKHRLRFLAVVAVTLSLLLAGAAGVAQAITVEQCQYFAANGKVSICHRTQSTRTPYVPMLVSVEACMGHAGHSADYVGFNDPMCLGVACLPVGAPSDGTVECCDGAVAQNGVCVMSDPTCTADGAQAGSASECCSGVIDNGICISR